MNYKPYNAEDRAAIFMWVLELDMTDTKKGKLVRRMYEEYRITHEQYKDVHEFIATTNSKDLQFLMKDTIILAQ